MRAPLRRAPWSRLATQRPTRAWRTVRHSGAARRAPLITRPTPHTARSVRPSANYLGHFRVQRFTAGSRSGTAFSHHPQEGTRTRQRHEHNHYINIEPQQQQHHQQIYQRLTGWR
eukprot:Mycagemm_TRINITY_DN10289_c2_g4::TRINITY_DN10289_c2_g4_i1::g.3598::m.3598 type:complete len:115 gc:universal TRINITY_DN10289_c2_g4_i1:1014-670(-)